MNPLRCLQISLFLLIDGLRHSTFILCEDPSCPRTLYDCNSLETEMHSTIDVILSPDFMLHVHDYHIIADMCRFFKQPSCSDSVLTECKGEVVYSSRAFKSRQQTICGDTLNKKDMTSFRQCSLQWHRHFMRCLEKRNSKLEDMAYVAHTSSSDHPWCNITSDYITCVYSIMALGCAMDVPEEYMKTINQSLPVVEAVFGYGCSFGHPLDLLKTTTPPQETTSQHFNRPVYTSGRRPTRQSRRSSSTSCNHRGVNSLLVLICLFCSTIGNNICVTVSLFLKNSMGYVT